MQNFAFPYFSRDIAEFWRRWHISLSTWFRDYLYIPLGGSRGSVWVKVRNIFIIFIVSGFWHGANWTFIVWGFLNALYFLPLMLFNQNRINTNVVAEGRIFPNLKELLQLFATFFITVIAWIFFRANNLEHAFKYFKKIFSLSFFKTSILDLKMISVGADIIYLIVFILFLLIFEWIQRNNKHAMELSNKRIPLVLRWSIYYFLLIIIVLFGGNQQNFIYFQF
jgi:D-alanyl-lipoteichoic acid acyltransferase DltB (MBOAT superfamily)